MRRRLARLAQDESGTTIIEFAIVAPVMLALLMGLFDVTYQAYLQSVLDGAIQKAGRDSSLEGSAANSTTIDNKVSAIVQNLAKNATFETSRRSYSTFALVKPETFTDSNSNGIRDSGECFDDVNNNGNWDIDPGRVSQGGANDVTKYTVNVTYPRIFPVLGFFGFSANNTLSSTTLLKNQPYKTQTTYSIPRVCT